MFNMEEGKKFSYCHKELDNRPPDQHIYRSDYSLDNIVNKVTIDHLAPCNSDDYFNVSFFFRVILGLTNRSPQILNQQYDHGYYRQIDKVLQPKPRMDMYFNGTFAGPHDIALVRLAGRDVVFIPGKIVPVRSKCMCTLVFFCWSHLLDAKHLYW